MMNQLFITVRKRSLGQGNIFTPVCHSVHRGVCLSACWDAPGTMHPQDHAPPRGGMNGGGMYGRGCAWQEGVHRRGACMAVGGMCGSGGVHGRGNVWQGVCMAGGMHGGGHAWQRGHAWQGACIPCMPPNTTRCSRSMCGRYASYWNAFLFKFFIDLFIQLFVLTGRVMSCDLNWLAIFVIRADASNTHACSTEEEYSLRLCFPSLSSVSVFFRALIFMMIFTLIFARRERGRYDKIAYSPS